MADEADRAQETIEQAMNRTLLSVRMESADTANECDECGDLIPSARQVAVPGCRYCIDCAEALEAKARHWRRG